MTSAASNGLLTTSWAVRYAAGEPTAVVRVRNLQTNLYAGKDAWGRDYKVQPLLVSVEASLLRPFDKAILTDEVREDTVHYGTLSKKILAFLASSPPRPQDVDYDESPSDFTSLGEVLQHLWSSLTGAYADDRPTEPPIDQPFLKRSSLRFLSITVCLPKASLLGSGVSLTTSAVFGLKYMYSTTLQIHKLRMPVLIGVNLNERQARQVVIADVDIDRISLSPDIYTKVESMVVKVLSGPQHRLIPGIYALLTGRRLWRTRPLRRSRP